MGMSIKSAVYLLSSEKHVIFALQKRSNDATVFAVRHFEIFHGLGTEKCQAELPTAGEKPPDGKHDLPRTCTQGI